MRSTFKVLFYLKRNAPKKNGLVSVMCRITVNGKIAQFSCKLDVEEKSWNVELGRMSGRSVVAQEANRMLDKIPVGINQAYQKIADRDNYVTAEKVCNAYLGLGMNHETLLAVFRQHNEDYEKQVCNLKSLRSYWKYCTVHNHLAEFIEKRYKVSDIAHTGEQCLKGFLFDNNYFHSTVFLSLGANVANPAPRASFCGFMAACGVGLALSGFGHRPNSTRRRT